MNKQIDNLEVMPCRPRLLVVMELMEGGELFDRISKQKGFTERQAAIFMKQVSVTKEDSFVIYFKIQNFELTICPI